MLFNLDTKIGGTTGYNILSYNLISGIRRVAGKKKQNILNLMNIITPEQTKLKDKLIATEIDKNNMSKFADITCSIVPFQSLMEFYGKVRVAYPMFEGSILHPFYASLLETLDYVLSPCDHLTELYKQHITVPVYTLHAGIDTDIYDDFLHKRNRRDLAEPYTEEDPCIFLNIGKFENRKASMEILIAFLKYFEDHPMRDKVILKLKWLTGGWSRNLNDIRQQINPLFKMYPYASRRVLLLDNPHQDVVKLYNEADCFLFPSRAEGIGLPLLEAMSCKLPCITTSYTALKDYGNPEASIVLPDKGQIPMNDEFYGIHNSVWGTYGKVEIDDLMNAFDRFISMSQKERLEMGERARQHVVQKFNNIEFAEKFLSLMEKINDDRRKTESTRASNLAARSPRNNDGNKVRKCCVEDNSKSCSCSK